MLHFCWSRGATKPKENMFRIQRNIQEHLRSESKLSPLQLVASAVYSALKNMWGVKNLNLLFTTIRFKITIKTIFGIFFDNQTLPHLPNPPSWLTEKKYLPYLRNFRNNWIISKIFYNISCTWTYVY